MNSNLFVPTPEAVLPRPAQQEVVGISPSLQFTHGYVLEELGGNQPDALIVLSAGIREQKYKGEPTGEWKSVSWGQAGDLGLHTGARTRVLAGVKIAEAFPDIPVVANSYNRNSSDEPTMASVVSRELKQRGVDSERIILEEDSFSTITQYIELLRLAKTNDWKKVVVTVNEYYEPRARAIFDHLTEIVDDAEVKQLWNDFMQNDGVIGFVNSEPILRSIGRKFVKYFEAVYNTPHYHEMVQMEAKGVKGIEEGTYKYSLQPNVERASKK